MGLSTRLGRLAASLRHSPATPSADPGAIAAREERLAERFLEDEALRGNLDGDTWKPVQDWLLAAIHRLVASTAGLDDKAAERVLDDGAAVLRSATQDLVYALEADPSAPEFARRVEPIHELLGRPPFAANPRAARELHAALRQAVREIAASHLSPPEAATRLTAALTPRDGAPRL